MKITESLIKDLIREEIENVTEMFGRNEDLPLPDDKRAALIKKTINGLRNIGSGAAMADDGNIIAAIAELVADLGGTLPDASTMEEGELEENFRDSDARMAKIMKQRDQERAKKNREAAKKAGGYYRADGTFVPRRD